VGPGSLNANTGTWSNSCKVPDAWDVSGALPGPGARNCGTVREIVEMNLRHLNQHVEEIRAIRGLYQI
jgi:hypothetical protein